MDNQFLTATRSTKQIPIKNRDLGFWTATPVTVQRFETSEDGYRELVWCNHAEADTETEIVDIPRIDLPDISYTVRVEVCPKCGAYRPEGDAAWQDVPEDGVSQ